MADFGAACGGCLSSFALQDVLIVVLRTLHRVCINGGVNREIGAIIEQKEFTLHERILAYIPFEAKIIYYILLNRIAIHIYHNQCEKGRFDANRTPIYFQ